MALRRRLSTGVLVSDDKISYSIAPIITRNLSFDKARSLNSFVSC